MRALDRKLLRDLRRIWAQGLAIALVLACGVAILVLANGALTSLTETRDAYYDRNRFADIFASATRTPESLRGEIARIDGVAQVETRVTGHVILDLPGMVESAMGRVLSLPENGTPTLNLPLLRQGRLPDPLHPDEVAISENFSLANDLRPGDSFHAILNGQLRELKITGLMLSPEFIYTIGPGTVMPDDRRFGLIWMGREAAAAAFDLGGAFNDISLRLTPGASEPAVIAALDHLLAPYGGTGAYGRDRQTSHAFLQNELDQLRAIALVVPPIFLIISAFLVNMVLGRLIALERQQIGLLKAVGYGRGEISRHYLKMTAGIGVIGVLLGWGAGAWLGRGMTALYAEYYHFPYLIHLSASRAFLISGALGMATVLLGALRAVQGSVRLSPAVAMSPPTPPVFRRGLLDRIGAGLRLRQTSMMILRSITRWPGRAAVTVFGVASSVAVLVLSFFIFDASDALIDEVFTQTNRQHVTLHLSQNRGEGVVEDARTLPGVLMAEGAYSVPVRLRHGPAARLLVLEARDETAELARLLDSEGRRVHLPSEGIALPEGLAADLNLRPGDMVAVELLVAPHDTYWLPVTATVRQSFGESLYMDAAALHRLMRQAPQINQVNLLVDSAHLPALHARIKATPAVSGMIQWTEIRRQFNEIMEETLLTTMFIYAVIGILMTSGVVYNAARIQLSERSHELASLRVLGFTRGEVGYILVGELMLLTFAALPLGWLLGYAFAAVTVEGLSTELARIPFVITRRTYAIAALITLAAAMGSALLVRRRLDKVEIATALKQKE